MLLCLSLSLISQVKHPRPCHNPPSPRRVSPDQWYYTWLLDKSTWLTQKINLFTHLEKTQSSNMANSSGMASWRFNQHNFLTMDQELWEEPVTFCSQMEEAGATALSKSVSAWLTHGWNSSVRWMFLRLSCASSEGLLSPCGLSLKDELSKQQRCSL